MVLLIAAGLLMRSLANTATADPGFEPSRVLAFDVSLPSATYKTDEKRMAFWNELRARVAAVPGVEHAGEGMAIPFSGGGFGEYFFLPGRTGEQRRQARTPQLRVARLSRSARHAPDRRHGC